MELAVCSPFALWGALKQTKPKAYPKCNCGWQGNLKNYNNTFDLSTVREVAPLCMSQPRVSGEKLCFDGKCCCSSRSPCLSIWKSKLNNFLAPPFHTSTVFDVSQLCVSQVLCSLDPSVFGCMPKNILDNYYNPIFGVNSGIADNLMENFLALMERSGIVTCRKNIAIESRSLTSQTQVTKQEICDMNRCETNAVMSSISDSCSSSAVQPLPGGQTNTEMMDQQMQNRKRQQISKHSKKKKRRMRKKSRTLTCKKNKYNGRTQSGLRPERCTSPLSPVRRSTVRCDWEDSEDDLCIVFEDSVDSCVMSIEDSSTTGNNSVAVPDLQLEFDSLTIVSTSGGPDVEKCSPEIIFEWDSDSEYDGDEVDSWPGLFIDSAGGLALGTDLHHLSFPKRTCLYDVLPDDEAGSHELRQVNRRWRKSTLNITKEPHVAAQVTFAPEDDLVTVFPVDAMDRKGEWEQFATGRFRFKRRIDEFEKLIAPYLTPSYRSAVAKKREAIAS